MVQDQPSFRAHCAEFESRFQCFQLPIYRTSFRSHQLLYSIVRATQRDVMQIWIWHVRVLRCPSVEALHHPMRTPAYVERLTKLRTVPDTHLYLTVFVKQGEKNWNINVVKLPKEKVNSFINSALLIVSLSREEFLSSQN